MTQKRARLLFAVAFLLALTGFVRVLVEKDVFRKDGVFEVGAEAERFSDSKSGTEHSSDSRKKLIVIDPGHGGFDPGKVGMLSDGTEIYEKDINLRVAKKVAAYLEANDYEVLLTRTEDQALTLEGQGSKKAQDMKARVAVIEENNPSLVVSIHQNSYPNDAVRGAQVFYYKSSKEGYIVATNIQKNLQELVDPANHRQVKPNDTYYLLKHVTAPIVIVECGFLTNPEECRLLTTEEYISRIAWAVTMGLQ